MVRFDNKISFLDLLSNGILDFQRSLNPPRNFSKINSFAQNQSKTCWDNLHLLHFNIGKLVNETILSR